jgi:hypothetical protein
MTLRSLNLQALSFPALIPREGFRWVCRDHDGYWRAAEPPADWTTADYLAADFSGDGPAPKPELSNRYYLAASVDEVLEAHSEQKTNVGHLVTEPDLYLQFASEKGAPERLKELANKFGLLDGSLEQHEKKILAVERSKSVGLEEAFRFHKSVHGLLHFRAEPAEEWLTIFGWVRLLMSNWQELREANDFADLGSYLDDGYNYLLSGSLTYQLELNEQTGEAQSRIICSTLRNYIDVQWGMSVAANVLHRQCAECPNWFAVHPGSSRPEKVFCSDACRMRAYRKRKNEK